MTRCVLFAEVPDFYAAIEVAQDPNLAGRALIVGGDPRKRGLVQAASAEARATGVEVEMPMLEALALCPQARVVRTDMALYRDYSRRLVACLRRGLPRLETFRLGGAFFELASGVEKPEVVAERLRRAVAEELGLPLRVGIASGKFLARLAAEESGPAGLRSVAGGEAARFLEPLPARRLEGVGRKTAAALEELGASTIGDVVALGRARLEEAFGNHGLRIYTLACALDDAPVRATRHPQSLSREVTVRGEALDRGVLEEHVQDLARHLEAELARQGLAAAGVTLKVRYGDGGRHSRSRALGAPVSVAADVQHAALGLLERTQAGSREVRSLGIQLNRLAPAGEADRQLVLFPAGS